MINRFIYKELQNELTEPEIDILLGARQVGKTTLLKALENRAQELGLKTAFFDLEQSDVLAAFNLPEKQIAEKLSSAGRVVFIDEFQYIQNASKIFKAIYDSPAKIKLICSGPSSLEIHKHLKESLAGRRRLFRIFPLDYAEIKQSIQDFRLDNYLRFGGMPVLTHTPSEDKKQILLAELLSAFILKDIKSLIKEENITAFNHLMYLLAQSQASVVSVHSLAKEVGLSSKALNRYLDILEQTFVNFRLHSFSTNLGNELKKSFKTYLYDLGVRNALLKDFSFPDDRADKGVLFESAAFLKLHSMLKPNMELRFWRTQDGSEVDFILVKDRKPLPIEIKGRLSHPAVPAGIKRFLARYTSVKKAVVINETQSAVSQGHGCSIHFFRLEDFLLQAGKILSF